jgi:hypothetical protein
MLDGLVRSRDSLSFIAGTGPHKHVTPRYMKRNFKYSYVSCFDFVISKSRAYCLGLKKSWRTLPRGLYLQFSVAITYTWLRSLNNATPPLAGLFSSQVDQDVQAQQGRRILTSAVACDTLVWLFGCPRAFLIYSLYIYI